VEGAEYDMAQVLQLPGNNRAFAPDVTAIMISAYDKAIGTHNNGQPTPEREVIAKVIIELAARGERDSERLCAVARTRVGLAR